MMPVRFLADQWVLTCALASVLVSTGSPVVVRAEIYMPGLNPDDLRVEVLVGRVGPEGELDDA